MSVHNVWFVINGQTYIILHDCRETRQRRQSTKKLEEENKKMEVRLQELKMAMNREKEERE